MHLKEVWAEIHYVDVPFLGTKPGHTIIQVMLKFTVVLIMDRGLQRLALFIVRHKMNSDVDSKPTKLFKKEFKETSVYPEERISGWSLS